MRGEERRGEEKRGEERRREERRGEEKRGERGEERRAKRSPSGEVGKANFSSKRRRIVDLWNLVKGDRALFPSSFFYLTPPPPPPQTTDYSTVVKY